MENKTENAFDPTGMNPFEENVAENQNAEQAAQGAEQKEYKEITLKFGKGCVSTTFTARDGNDYTSILIPNRDPKDHRPWETFVVRANAVHEDKYGKGMWIKLPEEGHTSVRRTAVFHNEDGTQSIVNKSRKVPNTELKEMVEFYKEERQLESVQALEQMKEEGLIGPDDSETPVNDAETASKEINAKEDQNLDKPEKDNGKKEKTSMKEKLAEKKSEVAKNEKNKPPVDKEKKPQVAL